MAASQTDEHVIAQTKAMHARRMFLVLPAPVGIIGLIATLVMVAAALIALQMRGSPGIGWVWAGWTLACAFVVGEVTNVIVERDRVGRGRREI